MIRIAVLVLVVAGVLFFGVQTAHALHLGAPPLPYHCQSGQHVHRWWVPDSSPVGAGAPGTLEWHGYREIAACASDLDAST